MTNDRYDAVVLGAGVSGLVSASLLADAGKSVLVLEEYEHIGGNHISCEIGDMSFDIGSFFFHENSAFFRYFPSLLEHYVPGVAKTAKIRPDGICSKYPFDLKTDFLHLPLNKKFAIATSLVWSRLTVDPEASALDFVTYWIGKEFGKESGLISYLQRFYSLEPSQIESAFAQKRMGWVANNASITNLLRRLCRKATTAKNRSFVRPRGGFQEVYSIAADILLKKGVVIRLGCSIAKISRCNNQVIIFEDERYSVTASEVYSTIPIAKVMRHCGFPHAPELSSAILVSLFYSLEGSRLFDESVLYNFHGHGSWKRLTMHSDFYGRASGKIYFSVEITVNGAVYEVEAYDNDFRADVASKGLFCGALTLEGSNILNNAYPIYLSGATAAAARAILLLADMGITSFGRQGGHDYQPTASVSASVAEAHLSGVI